MIAMKNNSHKIESVEHISAKSIVFKLLVLFLDKRNPIF
jgi:hypothetical protein